jgi:hypothetical protein
MIDCPGERSTQHFRGRWCGFGPVRNYESVVFAVFEGTKRAGAPLAADSFDNNHLKKQAQSLTRKTFVTKPVFRRTIARGTQLHGIAFANVSSMRALVADVKLNARDASVRSLCVLDRVEKGDCDGHATTGYCESHTSLGMSQSQLNKVRQRIRLDLADTFSDIKEITAHGWPSAFGIFRARVASIARTLRCILRNFIRAVPEQ